MLAFATVPNTILQCTGKCAQLYNPHPTPSPPSPRPRLLLQPLSVSCLSKTNSNFNCTPANFHIGPNCLFARRVAARISHYVENMNFRCTTRGGEMRVTVAQTPSRQNIKKIEEQVEEEKEEGAQSRRASSLGEFNSPPGKTEAKLRATQHNTTVPQTSQH